MLYQDVPGQAQDEDWRVEARAGQLDIENNHKPDLPSTDRDIRALISNLLSHSALIQVVLENRPLNGCSCRSSVVNAS